MVEEAIGLDAIIESTNRCDARKNEIKKTLEAIETVIWLFDPDGIKQPSGRTFQGRSNSREGS